MVDTYTSRHPALHFKDGVQSPENTLIPFQNIQDSLSNCISVKSRTTSAEPGSPSDGDIYYVPSGATGTTWGQSKNQRRLALYFNGWILDLSDTPGTPLLPFKEGDLLWVEDEKRFVVVEARTAGTPDTVTLRGIETVTMDTGFIASPSASEDRVIGFAHRELVVVELDAIVRGTSPSVTWTIRYATDRSAAGTEIVSSGTTTTSTTTGSQVTSLTNDTIPANSWIWLETSATSGTVDEFFAQLAGYF